MYSVHAVVVFTSFTYFSLIIESFPLCILTKRKKPVTPSAIILNFVSRGSDLRTMYVIFCRPPRELIFGTQADIVCLLLK